MIAEAHAPGPPLQGKTCLVTGATSGIGLITAVGLARLGARLVLVGRSHERCAAAVEEIHRQTGNRDVDAVEVDLSSQEQVRQFAEGFRRRHDRLDVLVNNAGAMFVPRRESVDGIEMTWALNHLSYFLLTNLLLDALRAAAPSRVVCVASDAHKGVRGIRFEDVQFKTGYRPFRAYSHSKLANVLFTAELARRLEGTAVTANSLHPGFVQTRFFEGEGRLYRLMKFLARFLAIPPEAGARTPIYLAGSPEVEGVSGLYFVKERPATPSRAARDADAARRLWDLSLGMTGLPSSTP
jgi:NAD(P)-dependent dehydrogenase (short-subunit alcohol dehydrogenase family)